MPPPLEGVYYEKPQTYGIYSGRCHGSDYVVDPDPGSAAYTCPRCILQRDPQADQSAEEGKGRNPEAAECRNGYSIKATQDSVAVFVQLVKRDFKKNNHSKA